MRAGIFALVSLICLARPAGFGLQCSDTSRLVGRIPVRATSGVEDNPAGGGPNATAGTGGTDLAGGAAGVDARPAALGPFGVPRLVAELSDPDADEAEPTLSDDELEIYFKSTRLEQRAQVFIATRNGQMEEWSAPSLVQELTSPEGETFSPELARDGLTLWMASSRPGGRGGSDLYVATRAARGQPWSTPTMVAELSTPGCDIDPGPLPEHDQFIATQCPDGDHNHLLLSQRAERRAPWGAPVYLMELNTAAKEGDPVFASDGLVLYFATTRDSPNGDDRADIWRAARASLGEPFGAPTPVQELNILEVDDQDPWVSNDERHIMFSSTRDRPPRELYEAFR